MELHETNIIVYEKTKVFVLTGRDLFVLFDWICGKIKKRK